MGVYTHEGSSKAVTLQIGQQLAVCIGDTDPEAAAGTTEQRRKDAFSERTAWYRTAARAHAVGHKLSLNKAP